MSRNNKQIKISQLRINLTVSSSGWLGSSGLKEFIVASSAEIQTNIDKGQNAGRLTVYGRSLRYLLYLINDFLLFHGVSYFEVNPKLNF